MGEAHADQVDGADVEALLRRCYDRVLFGAGRYRGSAVSVHRVVHQRTSLSAQHFGRWLTVWRDTVDQMYRGPAAERAKLQAGRIAWAIHRRLTGVDARELDALLAG
jgi:hemoglobin